MINRWTLYIIQRPVSAIVFHDGVLDTTKLSSHFWPLKSREEDIRSRGLFIGLVQNWRVAGLNTKYKYVPHTDMHYIQKVLILQKGFYEFALIQGVLDYRDFDYCCNSHNTGIFKNVDMIQLVPIMPFITSNSYSMQYQ